MTMNKKRIMVIQPYITNYRLPIFKSFSKEYKTTLCASVDNSFNVDLNMNDKNFYFIKTYEKKILNGKLFWQSGLIEYFNRKKYDFLFITANPRYLSTWVLLIFAKFKNKKVFLHGQGLYSKTNISILNRLIYFMFNILCEKYICYTNSSKDSLKKLSIYNKCEVADNSIVNENSIEKEDISQKGILFIGRLRESSNIEMLIKSIIKINVNNNIFSLHIIGGGDSLERLKSEYQYDWIKFYGVVYDNKIISEISKQCILGCYPGDAGLSVLHYMSLSLPVILHSNLKQHMGPEASYIEDDIEGTYFIRNNQDSLEKTLKILIENKNKIISMQRSAYKKYKNITDFSLSDRFLEIIKNTEMNIENT